MYCTIVHPLARNLSFQIFLNWKFHHSTVDKIDMFPSLTAVVVSLIAFLTLLDTLSAQTTSRLGKFSVSGTILIPIDIYDYSFPTMIMRFNC